jgi:hypothetical protein
VGDRAPEDYLAEVIEEFKRRDRLRKLVAQAGFSKSETTWVRRSALTREVAKLLGLHPRSVSLGRELRQFLLADGWKERRMGDGEYWRARSVRKCPACNWTLAKDGGCRRCAQKAAP